MGFFDKFKKKNEENDINNEVLQKEEAPYNMQWAATEDGRLQIDLYDRTIDEFREGYDTTRLVIGTGVEQIGGYEMQRALVSWYKKDDAIMLNRDGQDRGRRAIYKDVLTRLDLNRLQQDPNYATYVIKNLLERKRVEDYLQKGLQEDANFECGKYIGEVAEDNGQLKKVFHQVLGQASHYSDEMVQQRREIRIQREQYKQEKLKRLQQEMDELNRE